MSERLRAPDRRPRVAVRPTAPLDATTYLTWYIVALIAIPAKLIFAPLGGAGTPAQMLGMAAAGWWLWHRFAQYEIPRLPAQPVRRAMLVFVVALLASFVAAATRAINAAELQSSQLGLLGALAWLGVLLVATDGIPDRARLEIVLRRLAFGGGLVASLGILQFVTGKAFTDLIQIPGLTANNAMVSVGTRDGLTRPAGTALHAIEFGVAMTMILPICLYFAFHGKNMGRFRRWAPVVAIAFAIPISISRSAIVGTVVVLAFLMPTWPAKVRRMAVVAIIALLMVMFVTVPGMLGTISGMFTGISNDSSALSRTDSYGLAEEFVTRAPWFGRGFATFLPQYRILDNQYLGLLIDTGVVGLLSILALFVTGMVCARLIRRRNTDVATRELAQALAASVCSATVSFALFDALYFPMVAGLTFFLLGCVGALWRLQNTPRIIPLTPS